MVACHLAECGLPKTEPTEVVINFKLSLASGSCSPDLQCAIRVGVGQRVGVGPKLEDIYLHTTTQFHSIDQCRKCPYGLSYKGKFMLKCKCLESHFSSSIYYKPPLYPEKQIITAAMHYWVVKNLGHRIA